MTMYQETTRGIRVSVDPTYLESQSDPSRSHFVWAYQVTIANEGSETVQLLTRHWKITDGNGRLQEVQGPGVVGEQPVLKPGESFEYTSGTPLSTPSGIMAGTYQMQAASGEMFDAVVPAFSLDCPHEPRRVN
jgi:ApaG protein